MDFESMPLAPGGKSWLGHNADFRKNRLGMLQRLADDPRPLVRLKLPVPGVRAMVANHPDVAQEVLVEKAKHFDKSDMLRFGLYPLAREGLFTSNGELWARQRKTMAPLFQPKALERYASDMVHCSLRTLESWREGEAFPLARETTRLTMSIAGKTLFDADTLTEADEIGGALTVALEWTGQVVGTAFAISHILVKRQLESLGARLPDPLAEIAKRGSRHFQGPIALVDKRGRALARAIAVLDAHVQRMIDQRRAAPDVRGDLLTRLLEARDEEGRAMSDAQVRDEVLTLFVAGHETTATALAWSIYLACKHPAIYAAMEREADEAGDRPTVAELPALQLCLRVFKEALRLYPPVYMFGRDSRGEVEIAGYALRERTNTMISPWAMHHASRFWPDPERFDPERFLPENEIKRHRYSYLPFGAGPRICIGNHFAYMEAQLALAALLRRWRFELVKDDVPEPSATLRPREGILVRAFRRDRRASLVA